MIFFHARNGSGRKRSGKVGRFGAEGRTFSFQEVVHSLVYFVTLATFAVLLFQDNVLGYYMFPENSESK